MFRTRTLLPGLLVASSAWLVACPSQQKAGPAPLPPAIEVPFPRETMPEVERYLSTLGERIAPAWRQTITMAASLLPSSDPANQPDRIAEVEVELDGFGQPTRVRVSRSSGHPPYDASALRTISELGILPPLPASVAERRATLIWRFHRDGRGASPGAARLESRELTPEEALSRALRRGQHERAAAVLTRHGAGPTLLAQVAEAGLSSTRPELRLLALEIAPAAQIRTLLDREQDLRVWDRALEHLVTRREGAEIAELVDAVVKAGASADSTRAAAVLRALGRVGRTLPDPTAKKLLAQGEAGIAIAVAAATVSPALLDEAIAREGKRPGRAGPLAVRRCQLAKAASCEAAIRSALSSPEPIPTLDALERAELAGFDAELEALARNTRAPPGARARALALCARRKLSPKLLYLGLRATDPEVQLAAVKGLASVNVQRAALARRLLDLSSFAQGKVLAEAFAALARLGDEGSRADVLRRLRRLDAGGQAIVAAALHGYGEEAVRALTGLLAHPRPEVREAAAASLRKIPGAKAQAALAAAPAAPKPPAPEGLEGLLRTALELVKTRGS